MIDDQYRLIKLLGKGGSSKVFLAEDNQGAKYAIKALRKDKNFDHDTCWQMLEREHNLLQELVSHPNIINSIDVSTTGTLTHMEQTESVYYSVIEYAANGSLSQFIRWTGPLEENLARVFALQIFHAVGFVHDLGYCHLDIKLENILLDQYYNIKLADMGSSVKVDHTFGMTTKRRGTPAYMAPEVNSLQRNQKFNAFAADTYCLGVSLFVLLTGEFPQPEHLWNSISTNDTGNVEDSDYNWSKYVSKWDQLSSEVRKLILAMINPDPSKRPSVGEILRSEWFSVPLEQNALEEVYSEMDSRKQFIIKKFTNKF